MAGTKIKRANGKYKLSYMKNRERYNTTVIATNDAEADELLEKFVSQIDKMSQIDKNTCTLSEFVDLYFENYAYDMLGYYQK